jgi:HK97 family phage major capsid protein
MPFTALKAIAKTDTELRVRNHIVLFNSRDLEFLRKGANLDGSFGEYFDPAVDLESPATKTGKFPVDFEHRKGEMGEDVLGYVDWSTAKKDDTGWIVDRILDRRKKYVQMLEPLIEEGLIGTSSEPFQNMTKIKGDGGIIQWGLMRDTLTVNPAEPRMLGENAITALKNVSEFLPAAKSLLDAINKQTGTHSDADIDGTNHKVTVVRPRTVTVQNKPIVRKTMAEPMNILEAINQLVPGLTPEQQTQLAAVLNLSGAVVMSTDEQPVDESGQAMKSIKIGDLVVELKKMGYPVQLPGQKIVRKAMTEMRPMYETNPAASREDAEAPGSEEDPTQAARQKSIEAFHIIQYNDENEAQKAIRQDLIGKNYQQLLYEQNVAYATYLRHGNDGLDRNQVKALKTMYFPIDQVLGLVKGGFDVQSIKAVQVEAIGEMGGYAIPPEQQAEISRRLPGLTAVRGGGARVVTLVRSNSVEIPQYSGNSDAYIGKIRGQWGNETKTPEEKNFELDFIQVDAHVYTYKVPMSQSMVEDATNLVSLVQDDIVMTQAIDEDIAFLTGNGIKKPYGILPDGSNAMSLAEVVSGAAAALTANGVKALKRGIASQYRQNGVWVANSDTYGAIERLTYAGSGEYVFEDLSETGKLLQKQTYESGAMADVGAGLYPLLYAAMEGYTIVERLGMSIQRFQDSNTGPNKVEFHVRDRKGGRVEKPWLFAVQKVAAS